MISLRTGVSHACLSPKRQNLATLESGEKWFRIHFKKDYDSGLIIWKAKKKVELHRPILDTGDRAKMSALFQLTPSFNGT